MAVFRLLLVILNALFIILCMIECSGDLEASYSAVPYKKMSSARTIRFTRGDRTAAGHEATVTYIVEVDT